MFSGKRFSAVTKIRCIYIRLPAMEIKTPTPADLSALAHSVAGLDFFSPHNDPTQLGQVWQRGQAEGDMLLAAYEQDVPLGLCRFSASGTFGTGAYLKLIFVIPSAQGKGLGTKLLAAYESGCSPRGGYFVLTQQTNLKAQSFYAQHGYHTVGHLSDFAAPGRTDLILWKASSLV